MFYIIEKKDQLDRLPELGDCYIDFIPYSNNFHPTLQSDKISLVYVRSLNQHKGYILCITHNESLSLDKQDVEQWILTHTNKLFVLNKKQTLYYFPYTDKLFDINFIENVDISGVKGNNSINFYYNRYTNLPYINCLIPISKHYEEQENIFNVVKPTISKYDSKDTIYEFNNTTLTEVFHKIERNGVKIDKQCFLDCYGEDLKYPEFSIRKSRIYGQYNLHTLTGRPSNTFNSINFAALNKNSGERLCYRPSNDAFVEIDFNGYHPRLIGELVDYPLTANNIYEDLGIEKTVMFENLYGGIRRDNLSHPYFQKVQMFIDGMWDEYNYGGTYSTVLRTFKVGDINNQTKMFNYVIQALETYTNVVMLDKILDYLSDKKTQIVLYTYDAFLFDFSAEDGKECLQEILNIMKYPVSIKKGKSYHNLKQI